MCSDWFYWYPVCVCVCFLPSLLSNSHKIDRHSDQFYYSKLLVNTLIYHVG